MLWCSVGQRRLSIDNLGALFPPSLSLLSLYVCMCPRMPLLWFRSANPPTIWEPHLCLYVRVCACVRVCLCVCLYICAGECARVLACGLCIYAHICVCVCDLTFTEWRVRVFFPITDKTRWLGIEIYQPMFRFFLCIIMYAKNQDIQICLSHSSERPMFHT